MKRDLITISRADPLLKVTKLLDEHRIRRIPVVEGDELVGVITEKDIRKALPSSVIHCALDQIEELLEMIQVEEVMSRDVLTITANAPLEKAAKLMRDNKIGCLPVVKKEKLVGIVTNTDILDAFIEIMGIYEEKSVRIDLLLGDKLDAFNRLSSILQRHRSKVLSSGTAINERIGQRVTFFRLTTENLSRLTREIERAGFPILFTHV